MFSLCARGDLYETFNSGHDLKLPVIFIVENNKYAMGTSVERTSNVIDLERLGASYRKLSNGGRHEPGGMHTPSRSCGTRTHEGPTLLDIQTYRYKGHSMSDPQKYRIKRN